MKITEHEIHIKAEDISVQLYNAYILEEADMRNFRIALEVLIKAHSKGYKE